MCASRKNTLKNISGRSNNDFMSNIYIFNFSFMVPKRFQTNRLQSFGISVLSLMSREATPHIIKVSVDLAEGEAEGLRDAAGMSQPGAGRTRLQAQCQRQERDGDSGWRDV